MFSPAGYYMYGFDTGIYHAFDHILYERLTVNYQHFFWHGPCKRQHALAAPSSRYNTNLYSHQQTPSKFFTFFLSSILLPSIIILLFILPKSLSERSLNSDQSVSNKQPSLPSNASGALLAYSMSGNIFFTFCMA